MNDDEISKMFEEITPDHFNLDTSAVRVNLMRGYEQTTEEFYRWIQTNLEGTRIAMDVSSSDLPMFSLMANNEESRMFVSEQDETVSMMIARLSREAKEMQANWIYIALKSTAAIGTPTYDLSTAEGRAGLKKEKNKQTVVNWYAEQNHPDSVIEFGSILMDTREKHIYRGSDPRGAHPLFKSVMGNG